MRRVARGIAIAVGVVARRTARGEILASRGLRELPERGVGNATSC
jgi:hypothetical protein